MTTATLLATLEQQGVTVRVDGDTLRVKPWSAVPDELRAAIREHKVALLAMLTPAAVLDSPDLELGPGDLWHWRGFIMPTLGTMPTYASWWKRQETCNSEAQSPEHIGAIA